MINDIKRGPLANCIALHDFQATSCDFEKFLDCAESFYKKLGVEPTRGTSANQSAKTITYSRGKKQFEKMGYPCPESFWMAATFANHYIDMFGWLVETSFSFRQRPYFDICFDNTLCPYDPSTILELVQTFSEFFKPQYGYFYQRSFDKGPSFYNSGIISGLDWDKDRQERNEITNWGNNYNLEDGDYNTGDLRDIYPLNFITHTHLERVILGMPLKTWIDSNPHHGKVSPLTDSLFSWEVQKESIPLVRDTLRETGILLSF
jgi:hypothetical protein